MTKPRKPGGPPRAPVVPGAQYNRLTLLYEAPEKAGFRRVVARCDCPQRTVKEFYLSQVKNGAVKSCSCLRRGHMTKLKTTQGIVHGDATKRNKNPLYSIWCDIKHRCSSPKSYSFHNYGGRGITMHPAWVKSYMQFKYDVGSRPTDQHTLERVDNNKGYEPGNVTWATRAVQARNKRTNHMITFNDVTQCITDWANQIGIRPSTLNGRLRSGWSIAHALTTPKFRS